MIYWVLLMALLPPPLSWGQTYSTLTMVRPVATGAAGTGLHADNRVYRAYSGITYQIHADAIGGKWPYTYSLSNAPAGMTISAGPCTDIGPTNCTAGTITWTNPTASASNITVTVTDSLGTQVSGTWSITVSTTIGANGFCFLDANSGNDTTGSGTLAAPWQTLGKAHTSCGAASIIYLRAGTYTIEGGTISTPVDCVEQTTWNESSRGVIWIGYPGETATIDFRASPTTDGRCAEFSGWNMWFDNLTFTNVGSMAMQLNDRHSYGIVARNITGSHLYRGVDGNNSAYFMWVRYDIGFSYFDTIQNCTFSDISNHAAAIKVYSNHDALYENNTVNGSVADEAVFALKNGAKRYTMRGNICTSGVVTCIGGNMDRGAVGDNTQGDIYHNLCLVSGTTVNLTQGCLTFAHLNDILTTQVYRNTFVNGIILGKETGATDGLFSFYNNVIVNGGGTGGSCPARLSCNLVTDYTRYVVDANNVQGANDGAIANATTGALVGSYRTTYLGVAGYELAAVAATTNNAIDIRGGVRWNGGVIWR